MVVKKVLSGIVGVLVVIVSVFLVLAGSFSVLPTSISANQSANYFLNITVNNTDLIGNLTYVNITIPANLSFITADNPSKVFGTDALQTTLTNTSTVLSWNVTKGFVLNQTSNNFWFNITSTQPGTYLINITTVDNSSVSNSTTISIRINDTLFPFVINSTGNTVNATNISRNWIYYNVSVTELYTKNITFVLFNTTGLVNTTTFTMFNSTSNVSINWTGLNDGVYKYNATVYDTSGNFNSTSTQTITLDTTGPAVVVVSPTLVNTYYYNSSSVKFNISAIDLYVKWAQACWFNINGNGSNNQTMINAGDYFNYTNASLAETNYLARYYCNDSLNNLNSSVTTNFTIDTTNPGLTLTSPTNETPTHFDYVDFSFSLSDTNKDVCNLFVDGDTSTTAVVSNINMSSGSNTSRVSDFANGWHNWTVRCYDLAGNTNTSETRIFKIVVPAAAATDTGSGSLASYSTAITNSDIDSGVSKTLVQQGKFTFTSLNEVHSALLNSVDYSTKTASITISSTPQTFILKEGEMKKVELNNDGYYDLEVKVVSIVSSLSANIYLHNIHEAISAAAPQQPGTESVTSVSAGDNNVNDAGITPTEISTTSWNWKTITLVIVIIILVLFGVWYFLSGRKR